MTPLARCAVEIKFDASSFLEGMALASEKFDDFALALQGAAASITAVPWATVPRMTERDALTVDGPQPRRALALGGLPVGI